MSKESTMSVEEAARILSSHSNIVGNLLLTDWQWFKAAIEVADIKRIKAHQSAEVTSAIDRINRWYNEQFANENLDSVEVEIRISSALLSLAEDIRRVAHEIRSTPYIKSEERVNELIEQFLDIRGAGEELLLGNTAEAFRIVHALSMGRRAEEPLSAADFEKPVFVEIDEEIDVRLKDYKPKPGELKVRKVFAKGEY